MVHPVIQQAAIAQFSAPVSNDILNFFRSQQVYLDQPGAANGLQAMRSVRSTIQRPWPSCSFSGPGACSLRPPRRCRRKGSGTSGSCPVSAAPSRRSTSTGSRCRTKPAGSSSIRRGPTRCSASLRPSYVIQFIFGIALQVPSRRSSSSVWPPCQVADQTT